MIINLPICDFAQKTIENNSNQNYMHNLQQHSVNIFIQNANDKTYINVQKMYEK